MAAADINSIQAFRSSLYANLQQNRILILELVERGRLRSGRAESGHRDRIERVAAALLAEKELSGEQVDELTGRSVDDVPDRLPPRFRGWVGSGVPR